MTLRPLFALIIAVAMLFAPFAMPAGSAMAAPPGHHDQTMTMEHCGGQDDGSAAGAMPDGSCCMAMCAAVAVPPSSAGHDPLSFASLLDRPGIAQFGRSFLAKLATPPPRLA